MTTAAFIDQCNPDHPQQVKELAKFNGIKLDKPIMSQRINKIYELAQILDVDAPLLVEKIIQTELMA